MIWRCFSSEVEIKSTAIKLETNFKFFSGQAPAKAPRPPGLSWKRIVAKSPGGVVLKRILFVGISFI